ncbi:LCP family protein [Streptomyces wuyuanensis]|uniref:Cell envelope-related function transcriptional attenuator common domain-containing protein n=1 Tax=Streptomyces wuyuanensis TaxID=1196353 RepID=A0A1G9ZVX6_9ACTN|nr:LCP family protein [Streptomyces wuyuanensis]SDN25091.1 cell envelope-related function transcriptional attenuator common domain-containing protein [Streptomyces wuyuanensis]
MRRLIAGLTVLAGLASWPWIGAQAAPAAGGAVERNPGRGTNILIVGIDSRAGLSAAEKRRLHVGGEGCDCTDVMMLVHLSEDRRRASVVSIPRDSYVQYATPEGTAGEAPHGKINGAFKIGRGPLAVRTVEKVTGLSVDHYLETDFTGFERAVDDLGGATVCTDKPLRDENSGLDITTGTHHLDGNRALGYARARHLDPPGDLGRVRRQQRMLADMLDGLTVRGALADPVRAADTARRLLGSVRTDERTGMNDLIGIGWTLGRLPADRTEFATVPISHFDHRVPGVGSTLLWHESRARALWEALRADRPITGDTRILPVPETRAETNPAGIRVRVDDAKVATALERSRFVVTDTSASAPAVRPAGPAVITFPAGREADAATLAAALPGARLRSADRPDAVFDVTVGSEPVVVKTVTYDRNVAEGAPVTADRLRCSGSPAPASDTAQHG